jgi:hypothetical protein
MYNLTLRTSTSADNTTAAAAAKKRQKGYLPDRGSKKET